MTTAGADVVGLSALANFGFAFPSAKIGGTLKLTISDSNYDDSTITLKTQ